jgi:hypothetical protein
MHQCSMSVSEIWTYTRTYNLVGYTFVTTEQQRAQAYDDLVTEFMEAAKSVYGEGVLLQVRMEWNGMVGLFNTARACV